MRVIGLIMLVLWSSNITAQPLPSTPSDSSEQRIKTARQFLESYLSSFRGRRTPDFRHYWSAADLKRSALPDDIVYAIADDYPTYMMGGSKPSVFFARAYPAYVQLKTLFASPDAGGNITPWAITNHYVIRDSSRQLRFISELELHQHDYQEVTNRNITYHFPASMTFSYAVSNRMLKRLLAIEQQWGFTPIDIHYYYAYDGEDLARMRGMDYNFAMDEQNPSGISYPEHKKIFCQGLGEGYLHEVLHIYFNPVYGNSPMCHALIYYLAGGIGKDFDWFIRRMNDYLQQHPETDLSRYETLTTNDRMLHIDYVVKGLLCKMIDERDGTPGLKRALQYASANDLLKKEFGVESGSVDRFLKTSFGRYAGVKIGAQ